MGTENRIDPSAFTLFWGDTPIARGEIALAEIKMSPEMTEPTKELPYQCVGFMLTFKTPKRWRCKSRKRFIKLIMSEGISRNYATKLADFVRERMQYGRAWREYVWRKL